MPSGFDALNTQSNTTQQSGFDAINAPSGKPLKQIAGYTVIGYKSSAPIHYGTHNEPGTYDVTAAEVKRRGKTLEQAAKEIAAAGYTVAVRRKGQSKITNDHLHIASPNLSPKESQRISKQRGVVKAGGGIAAIAQRTWERAPEAAKAQAARPKNARDILELSAAATRKTVEQQEREMPVGENQLANLLAYITPRPATDEELIRQSMGLPTPASKGREYVGQNVRGAVEFLPNLAGDVGVGLRTGRNPFESAVGAAKPILAAGKGIGQQVVDTVRDPVGAVVEHPLETAMLVAPLMHGVVKGVRAVRGKSALPPVREPVVPRGPGDMTPALNAAAEAKSVASRAKKPAPAQAGPGASTEPPTAPAAQKQARVPDEIQSWLDREASGPITPERENALLALQQAFENNEQVSWRSSGKGKVTGVVVGIEEHPLTGLDKGGTMVRTATWTGDRVITTTHPLDELAKTNPDLAAKYAEPPPPEPAAEGALTELHAGVDPRTIIRKADDLNITPSARDIAEGRTGTFTAERPQIAGRDFDLRDRLLQPLGLYGPTGEVIRKGAYDHVGEVVRANGDVVNLGSKTGWSMRQTERAMTDQTLQANRQIDSIVQLVKQTVPRRLLGRKPAEAQAFKSFVDLIEKPFDDPTRVAPPGPLAEALKLHDQMTESFRNYIVESRRSLGIETPDGWGITDKGYFRHLFLGDIRVFKDGSFVGAARTYAEAQKMALDILKTEPKANITARARNQFFGDPTVRVSSRKFFGLVGKMADEVGLTKADILEDIRGIVGRKAAKQKFAGFLLKREGTKGYSTAYEDVMRIHAAQVIRTQELSKMNRAVQSMVEELRRSGKPGLADEVEAHVNDLWGTPSKWEKDFGRLIENTPILRNHVANPALAFRGLARKLTGLQFGAKLRMSPRSALVNLIQPFSTLWPYTSTTEFLAAYKDFAKPAVRARLRQSGVLGSSTKLETTGLTARQTAPSSLNPLNWFTKASETNRGVGYLVGERLALKRGMTPEQAHQMGLSFAELTEFDNSQWNIQPLLRSPQGRVLGQFKSFAGKNLQNVRQVFAPSEPVPTGQRVARAAKWGGTQLAVGGLRSLGKPLELVGGYLVIRQLSKQLQSFGMKQDDADNMAHAVYYGAPSLIGQDLSSSVMIFEGPFGWSTEGQLSNFVFGPTVGTAIKLKDAIAQRNIDKAAGAMTPAFKTFDVLRKLATDKRQTIKVGNQQELPLTDFEAIMRALGFTPVQQTEWFDKKDAGIKNAPTLSLNGGRQRATGRSSSGRQRSN